MIIAAFIPNWVGAESLGRLFFTPEQRVILDNARKQKIEVKVEEEATVPQLITLNGMVKRSDGASTIWVNQKAVTGQHSASGLTVVNTGNQGNVVLQLPQSTDTVKLKVGQNLDMTSGEISESYVKPSAMLKTPQDSDSSSSLKEADKTSNEKKESAQ
jgi:hypothetical protein